MVLVPTNRAVNVPTNSPLECSGPAYFSSVYVEAYQSYPSFVWDGYTSLPANATNWPSPPALLYGTNYFYVSNSSNNFPGVTITTPVDAGLNPVSSWGTEADLFSDTFISFVVGRLEAIQMRTNLTGGVWMNVTNFIGDGWARQFAFSITNAPGEYFRVLTQ